MMMTNPSTVFTICVFMNLCIFEFVYFVFDTDDHENPPLYAPFVLACTIGILCISLFNTYCKENNHVTMMMAMKIMIMTVTKISMMVIKIMI